MIYIDAEELERYQKESFVLREELNKKRTEKIALEKELTFLKDSGDEIMVIVKDATHDTYEYKSTEKELLNQLVLDNKDVRDKYDELLRYKDNLENQKQLIILKYNNMENQYTNLIGELDIYITELETRSVFGRLINTKKIIRNRELFLEHKNIKKIEEPIHIIYSDAEVAQLEANAKSIQKPRGWHFKEKFIDSVGNVYHKGKLQPHLKEIIKG